MLVGVVRARRIAVAVVALGYLLGPSGQAFAQAVTNPQVVQFNPSPDHGLIGTNGQPIVANYNLAIYQTGGASPFQVVGLGKPEPGLDGKIQVSLASVLSTPLTPLIVYEARVAAVGPGGFSASEWSNSFAVSVPCSYSVTVATPSFSAAGGSSTVSVTAGNGCTWSAGAVAQWATVAAAGGTGDGSVGLTVTANDSPLSRSTLVTVAGQTLSIVQSGMGTTATLPPGFSESLIASGLQDPTAMDFAPDGRLFVSEQGGTLRVIKDDALLPAPFVTLTVDQSGERGLLGVAVDPAFVSNHYVYVYYTATTPASHNRVSRFTANADVAVAGSEVVILELEPLGGAMNNGGAIHFGIDGKLYVGVGDNADGANSQTLANRLGKMLRVNADGTIPSDNPFFGTATGANRSIWALGLRNPSTFAVEPVSGRMFINDVGQSAWEEINHGVGGANFGWSVTEGPTTNANFSSPLFAYDHADGCAISGGAFHSLRRAQFPLQYWGGYFFADRCGGWIHFGSSNGAIADFASGISQPVDLKMSSDGSLYSLARNSGGTTGVVSRITYGPVVPNINLTTSGGDDPVVLGPTDPLQISWSFDAGNPNGVNPAELYLGVFSPIGLIWFDSSVQRFVLTPARAYSGALPSFGPSFLINAPNAGGLPAGHYWWFVIVVDRSVVPNRVSSDMVLTVVN